MGLLEDTAKINEVFRRGYAAVEKKKRLSKFTEKVFIPAHMNELPCPFMPWRAWNLKKQGKYNAMLGLGLAMFAVSVGLCVATGATNINFGPPDQPAPREGQPPPPPRIPPCDNVDDD